MLKNVIIISLVGGSFNTSNEYKSFFTTDYNKGIGIIETNNEKFEFICNEFEVNAKHIKSIVFPETIRYNSFKDFFETTAIELMYIDKGSSFVDFSIGYFQIKPSFVEQLEATIKKNDSLRVKYGNLSSYSAVKPNKIRETRLTRLKSVDWQISYICCMYDYLNLKYPELKNEESKMIEFYASAYNFGFKKPPQKINKWASIKAFPYGSSYTGNQFSYSEIALHFLRL